MHTTYAYEVQTTDRRHRYEAQASRRRLLGGVRHHVTARRASAPGPAGDPGVAIPASTPLGRTSSGVEQRAA
jgi:hypothetical protein